MTTKPTRRRPGNTHRVKVEVNAIDVLPGDQVKPTPSQTDWLHEWHTVANIERQQTTVVITTLMGFKMTRTSEEKVIVRRHAPRKGNQ